MESDVPKDDRRELAADGNEESLAEAGDSLTSEPAPSEAESELAVDSTDGGRDGDVVETVDAPANAPGDELASPAILLEPAMIESIPAAVDAAPPVAAMEFSDAAAEPKQELAAMRVTPAEDLFQPAVLPLIEVDRQMREPWDAAAREPMFAPPPSSPFTEGDAAGPASRPWSFDPRAAAAPAAIVVEVRVAMTEAGQERLLSASIREGRRGRGRRDRKGGQAAARVRVGSRLPRRPPPHAQRVVFRLVAAASLRC
jgi:hypothetical protein